MYVARTKCTESGMKRHHLSTLQHHQDRGIIHPGLIHHMMDINDDLLNTMDDHNILDIKYMTNSNMAYPKTFSNMTIATKGFTHLEE